MVSRCGGQKCVVCNRGYRSSTNIRLFTFPKERKRLKVWLQMCKLEDININTARICNLHFEEKYIGTKFLLKYAIPTRNLNMSKNCNENENIKMESNTSEDTKIDLKTDRPGSALSFDLEDHYISDEEDLKYVEECQEILGFTEKTFIDSQSCTNCRDALERESKKRSWEKYHCLNCDGINKKKLFYKNKLNRALHTLDKQIDKNKMLRKRIRLLNLRYGKLLRSTEYVGNVIESANISAPAKSMTSMLLCKKHVWRLEEQFVAEKLYSFSPDTYKFLRDQFDFNLPSLKTLKRWAEIKDNQLREIE